MNNKEIFMEIENCLLSEEKPSISIENMLKESKLDSYPLSMIKDLEYVEQNPKFHPEGNVFIHTMMVVDEGAKYRKQSNNKRVFMWALLLHDIGKKPTTKLRKGRLTSYNHDIVGADMTKKFLEYFNEEEYFIKKVQGIVRWHMQSLFVAKNIQFQNLDDMVKEVDKNEIVLVALSDRLGRGNLDKDEIDKNIKEINIFKEKVNSYFS